MANYKQQLDNILRTFQEGGNVKKPATDNNLNADTIELNEAIVKPNNITNLLSKDNLNYLRDVRYANEWLTHQEAAEKFAKETGVGYNQLNDRLDKDRQERRAKPLDRNWQKYISESSLRYLQDELFKDMNLSDTEAVITYALYSKSKGDLNKNIEFDIQERRRNGITSQPNKVSKYQNIIEGTKKKTENNVTTRRSNPEISNNSRTQEDSQTQTNWQQKALEYEQAENEKLARRIAKSSEDIINSPEHAQLISELSQQSRDEWNTNPNKEQDVRSKRANVIRSLENREPTEEELDQYVNTLKGIKKIGGFIKKFQTAGTITTNPLNSLVLNANNFDSDWYGDYSDIPQFDYKDIDNTRNRWSYLSNLYNQDTDGFNLNTIEGLNKLAGTLQRKGVNDYNPVANHYAMNMAPTRDGLRDLIANKVFTADELKGYGVKIGADGLPQLGADEVKMTVENKGKLVNDIQSRLDSENFSNFKNSYISKNFVDDKAYHRFFEMRTVEFDSQDELDKFKADRGFKNLDGSDDIYTTDKTGAYVKLKVKDPKEEDDDKDDTDPNDGLDNYRDKKSNYTETRPTLTPDQSNLPPRYFGTRMRSIRSPWNVANYVSPNATVREISRQGNTARRLLNSTNPYTSAAAIANMQGQENDAIMNAVMTSEMANQQAQNQTDMVNEDRVNRTDSANMSESLNYELRSNQGQDAYYKEWMNYIDRRNQERLVNYNMQNQVNAINAMHPNYNVNAFGQIAQTDEPFVITAETGVQYIIDPKTNKATKINKEEKSDKKKPDTKKNGGTLRDFLKSNRKKG